MKIYDIVSDESNVSVVLSTLGKLTLDEVVGSFSKTCPMELAHSTISKLVRIVCKVHACGVLHRNICQAAIGMTAASANSFEGYKVVKMGGFDFARHIDNC